MSIVVDERSPAPTAASVACASGATPNGTIRNFTQAFNIPVSTVEAEITARGDVTPWVAIANESNDNAPPVDVSSFFHATVSATTRF